MALISRLSFRIRLLILAFLAVLPFACFIARSVKDGYRQAMMQDGVIMAGRNLSADELTYLGLGTLLMLVIIALGGEMFFIRPLGALLSITRRISAGELDVRTGLEHGHGELGLLAQAFDGMAAALQKRQIESEQLEEILRESGRRLRAIFNQAFQFIGLLQPDGIVLEVNQTALDFGGLTNADVFGKPLWETRWWAVSPEAGHRLRTAVLSASEGHFVRYETDILGADNTIASVDLSLKPVKDESGQVVLLIFEARDITERKEAERALRKSEGQLRYLSTQLLKAQEVERKRIAQELHDSVGQSLSAIKYSVESILNSLGEEDAGRAHPALEPLQAVIPLVQHTVEETRRIMTDLRPSILDDLGIVATLGWFVRELHKVYPAMHVEKRVEVDEEQVPDSLKVVIYRIVQEAFHNIVKYSKAEYVDLCLTKNAQAIELIIEDNGIGFDIDEALAMRGPASGLGLASMRERTELSGGTFTIQSIRGEGTAIHIEWRIEGTNQTSES